MYLKNKNILIGVSGSISAYKIALLVRLLIKECANIKIVMTESAKTFITPLTLATLSKNPVLSSFSTTETGDWNNHVELGLWADVMLIAPATANTLAKCANGFCDNLLVATYLSARCKVFFAPAMDLDMYSHFSTRNNLEILTKNGNQIIEPTEGELASGLEGKGRMAEPDQILKYLEANFAQIPILKGKKVLISAGPTQEAIDPVRFISNHSSGKMGYEIAKSFAMAGAQVTLISGPTSLQEISFVKTISVNSAQEMMEKMDENHKESDIVIFSAAVADYAPAIFSSQKIKKKGSEMSIELKKTVDIAAELGKKKWGGSPLIGAGFYQGRTGQQRGSFVSLMYNLGAPSFGFISPQGLGANNSPILIRIGYFF